MEIIYTYIEEEKQHFQKEYLFIMMQTNATLSLRNMLTVSLQSLTLIERSESNIIVVVVACIILFITRSLSSPPQEHFF